jgi:tRNA A-37 threonylcarbamoyl transferase component Bud32
MDPHARIGTEVGNYLVESFIGQGGMGVVYLAQHTRLKQKRALKILDAELAHDQAFRERFFRESELAASLEHPNIIPVHDAGEANGVLYIAMRFIDGTDLRALLEEVTRLDPPRAIQILGDVAGALDAAHRAGLVHRDVKPGNIMIERASSGPREHVYLTDFGLVKRMDAGDAQTMSHIFLGTVDYAAPEQFKGEVLDGRADQYALGCVLFECLTGDPPFRREQDAAVMYAHIAEERPSVTERRPELPKGVDPVVGKAMARSREERFGTCSEMIAAARARLMATKEASVAPVAPVVAPAPPRPAPGPAAAVAPAPPARAGDGSAGRPPSTTRRPRGRRWRRVLVAAILAVAVLVAGVIILTSGGKGGGPTPPTGSGSPTGTALPALTQSAFVESLPVSGDSSSPDAKGRSVVSGTVFSDSVSYALSSSDDQRSSDFRLPGRFARFEATLGLDPEANVEVEFVVKVGGVTQKDEIVQPDAPGLPVSVPLTGATTLTLAVSLVSCQTLPCQADAIWGNAELVGSGTLEPTVPIPPSGSLSPTTFVENLGQLSGSTATPTTGLATIKGRQFSDSVSYALDSSLSDQLTDFEVVGNFSSFTATVGLESGSNVEVRFQVLVNAAVKFTMLIKPGQQPFDIPPIPMTNAGKLTLQVTLQTCQSFPCQATAVWGNAKILGS